MFLKARQDRTAHPLPEPKDSEQDQERTGTTKGLEPFTHGTGEPSPFKESKETTPELSRTPRRRPSDLEGTRKDLCRKNNQQTTIHTINKIKTVNSYVLLNPIKSRESHRAKS